MAPNFGANTGKKFGFGTVVVYSRKQNRHFSFFVKAQLKFLYEFVQFCIEKEMLFQEDQNDTYQVFLCFIGLVNYLTSVQVTLGVNYLKKIKETIYLCVVK